MIASDWAGEVLVVVGDQGALVGRADLPVPPDRAGPGEQPLGAADVDAGQGTAAVAFQAKLVLEGVEGALDPLPDPAQRPHPAGLVGAVRSQQPRAVLGDQPFEVATSKVLVDQDEQARPQP